MRIVFAGTPDFAAHTLAALIAKQHDVICVYTQPDRKTGRGQKLTPPPVKQLALEHNINVEQPSTLKTDEEYQTLKALKPDLMIVVAYGMLLPQRILDIPKHGCLNIHASLLPKWRGAAPIQRAIEAGDNNTGVCIMQMEAGLDTGPVLSQTEVTIKENDTSASMHDKLAEAGAISLLSTLESLKSLQAKSQTQEHDAACYAHKITKAEATIQQDSTDAPGTIIKLDKNGFYIKCGQDVLSVKTVQRDGSKPMPISDFMNSTNLQTGDQFS